MITVDIVSPGGAFTPAANADTQELTTTFSISSGSPTLTCIGASPFVSGDTGKSFVIKGPGSAGGWMNGTLTYVSANQVTLSSNASTAMSTQSAYMAWGSDDSAAFRAFNDWARIQTDSITLTLGSGSKNFIFGTADPSVSARGGGITWGIPHPVTIQGNGPSSTKFIATSVNRSFALCAPYYLKSGNSVWGFSSDFTARLNTIAAGATTATCTTTADATLFTANTWALLSGMDLQGLGQPPNPFYYEYVYITNVDAGTGVITFQTGVQDAYLGTWPHFTDANIGFEPDHGGPPTLYALDPGWNVEATFENLTFVTEIMGQVHSKGRKIVLRNVTASGDYGYIPTGSKETECYDCDLSSFQMEIDKIVESVIFDNTACGQLRFQSSLNRVIFRNGSTTSSGFNGTPRYLTITDSTVNGLGLGTTSFGRMDSFITTGSTFTGSLTYIGIGDDGDNGGGSFLIDYTVNSTGMITMPRSGRDYPGVRWAVPGTKCFMTGVSASRSVGWGPMFTVTAVTADATNIYVQTDWSYSSFPSWVSLIQVVPSNYMSFGADTVSSLSAIANVKAASALGYTSPGTYSTATLTGATAGTDTGGAFAVITPNTGGKLVSLVVDVTTPYTGAQATLKWGHNNAVAQWVLSNDGSTFTTYNPSFDLKTAGRRIITPSGVTGTAGTDTGLTFPYPNAWVSNFLGGLGTGSHDIRAEYAGNPSVGPVFTVELILNQNRATAVAPLRLRLRAA